MSWDIKIIARMYVRDVMVYDIHLNGWPVAWCVQPQVLTQVLWAIMTKANG